MKYKGNKMFLKTKIYVLKQSNLSKIIVIKAKVLDFYDQNITKTLNKQSVKKVRYFLVV